MLKIFSKVKIFKV